MGLFFRESGNYSCESGNLSCKSGKLMVDIPVMNGEIYEEINSIINDSYRKLDELIGADFREFINRSAVQLPPHLKSVPEYYRYITSTQYIVMSAVREAYGRGLHMHDVNYCCPPCIVIYS